MAVVEGGECFQGLLEPGDLPVDSSHSHGAPWIMDQISTIPRPAPDVNRAELVANSDA
jgi:hypothetical protein